MKEITKKFITDMINFMEDSNIKVIKFCNCTVFCSSNKDYINENNTPYRYALHYTNPFITIQDLDCMTALDWQRKRKIIITADNKERFFKNLSISKIYGKSIYDSVKEIKSISKNRYKEVK